MLCKHGSLGVSISNSGPFPVQRKAPGECSACTRRARLSPPDPPLLCLNMTLLNMQRHVKMLCEPSGFGVPSTLWWMFGGAYSDESAVGSFYQHAFPGRRIPRRRRQPQPILSTIAWP